MILHVQEGIYCLVGTIYALACLNAVRTKNPNREGRTMNMHWITCSAAAVTVAAFMSAAPASAAMVPAILHTNPAVQHVDCAIGFHIGPAGACIIGVEEKHDRVIERRATDDDCTTKTVKRTNGEGDSVIQTTKKCD